MCANDAMKSDEDRATSLTKRDSRLAVKDVLFQTLIMLAWMCHYLHNLIPDLCKSGPLWVIYLFIYYKRWLYIVTQNITIPSFKRLN